MDLTKLYNFSTPELREEAERLGVTDTYALSRAQLIHAIRLRAGEPPPEGFFGRVVGFAKRALQASATEPQPVPSTGPTTHRLPQETDPTSEKVSDTPSSRTARQSEVPSLFSAPPPGPKTTSSGPPARAPTGVFSGGASKFEEPFPTRTMARILAGQGHYKRSLAIYADLIRAAPEDHELQGEADSVRAQSRARRPHT
ncbi:MAG: hypothetical protein WBG86_18970 [Polyangiales bacterium]